MKTQPNLPISDNVGVTEQENTSHPQLPHAVRHFDQLPAVARLRTREVLILAGISRATLYRRIEAETFPKPQKTPTGTCFWTAATVRAALEAEVAE